MGHQLHSDPPVWLHGIVSRVRTLGYDGISDVIQNRGHILLPTVAVRAHQSHLVLEAGFPIILLHVRGCLVPQLVGRAGHNVTGQDASGHDEVSWFHYGHFYSPGFHLIAKAIRKGFHAEFGYTVRRAHDVSHPAVHAGQVHHAACGDVGNRDVIRLLYSSATKHLTRFLFKRNAEYLIFNKMLTGSNKPPGQNLTIMKDFLNENKARSCAEISK